MQDKRIVLPFLVFWVGQRCTLHCKDCTNLIPYGEQRLYDVEKSLLPLSLLTTYLRIGRVQIQGGEPLTHPQLVEFIEIIAQLPIEAISITTNGTILFSDELLATLKRYPHIHITISNYDVRKKTREKVVAQLKEHNIDHSLYEFLYGTGEWFNSGGFHEQRNDNDEEVARIYQECDNKGCWTLADGKLSVCGKIPILSQYHNTFKHDAHNVLDIGLFVEQIKKDAVSGMQEGGGVLAFEEALTTFLSNVSQFKEWCRYCLGTKGRIKPAIQLTPQEVQSYASLRKVKEGNNIAVDGMR